MPGEYRKSDVLCQDGEEQFDNSVVHGLNYMIGETPVVVAGVIP